MTGIKDVDTKDKLGVVYSLACNDCYKVNIRETVAARNVKARAKDPCVHAGNGHPELSAAAQHARVATKWTGHQK